MPDQLSLADAGGGLNAGHDVPGGGCRGVAKGPEGVLRGLGLLGSQLQGGLQFLNHTSPSSVQQKVVEYLAEVGLELLVHSTSELQREK